MQTKQLSQYIYTTHLQRVVVDTVAGYVQYPAHTGTGCLPLVVPGTQCPPLVVVGSSQLCPLLSPRLPDPDWGHTVGLCSGSCPGARRREHNVKG